jgi:hypothetical protein
MKNGLKLAAIALIVAGTLACTEKKDDVKTEELPAATVTETSSTTVTETSATTTDPAAVPTATDPAAPATATDPDPAAPAPTATDGTSSQ